MENPPDVRRDLTADFPGVTLYIEVDPAFIFREQNIGVPGF